MEPRACHSCANRTGNYVAKLGLQQRGASNDDKSLSYRGNAELTFIDVHAKSKIPKSVENYFEMLLVFVWSERRDENVLKISEYEIQILQCSIYVSLERLTGVAKSKSHNCLFKKVKLCNFGGLRNVRRCYRYFMTSHLEINFSKTVFVFKVRSELMRTG